MHKPAYIDLKLRELVSTELVSRLDIAFLVRIF